MIVSKKVDTVSNGDAAHEASAPSNATDTSPATTVAAVPPNRRDKGPGVSEPEFGLFGYWDRAGFRRFVIPVAPFNALGPDGRPLNARGKCPAVRVGESWRPMSGWQRAQVTEDNLRAWGRWESNVGLLARHYPACDIDVLDPELADEIHRFIVARLGSGPVRRGNDPKRLIVYAAVGAVMKRRLSFHLSGDDRPHAVEVLGMGQQYVVEGIHPTTERPYSWDDDVRPVPGSLRVVTQAGVDECMRELEAWLIHEKGAAVVGPSAKTRTRLSPAEKAQLEALAKRVADGDPMDAFLQEFDRPELREDALALLRSSQAAKNIAEGVEVHDSHVAFGREAAVEGLSKLEAIGLCRALMEDCPHPDRQARIDDLPRCVGDGWERGMKHLADWGQFAFVRFWQGLGAVEQEFGEHSEEAAAYVQGFDDKPTPDELDAYRDRRRRTRVVEAGTEQTAMPTRLMQSLPLDVFKNLKARDWIYAPHYIRGYVSTTISPGGHGKSSLVLAEALAIATGKNLLGKSPLERVPVFYFNGEDPRDEIERRVAALMIHYNLTAEELQGWFFYESGRQRPLLIAEQDREGVHVNKRALATLIEEATEHNVGLIIFDPFVSVHAVEENNNMAVDRVVKQALGVVIHETGCGVELVHHSRKTYGAQSTAEDGRGASSLQAAARSVRLLNRATADERRQLRISDDDAFKFFRLDHGKANMTPAEKAEWYMLDSVTLEVVRERTGDSVHQPIQVVKRWHPPERTDALTAREIAAIAMLLQPGPDGPRWRKSSQSPIWAGRVVEAVRVSASTQPELVDRSNSALSEALQQLVLLDVIEWCDGLDERHKRRPSVATRRDWSNLEGADEASGAGDLAARAKEWLQRTHNLTC